MFKKSTLTTDSQLSHEELANSLMNQAIEQMVLLSGLTKAECERLIMSQFSPSISPAKRSEKDIINYNEVISEPESEYITRLFN